MLHYKISGSGTEDLVLLHGFMENLNIWNDMEPKLSERFRLIKIDLPGHGQSRICGETHSMDFMAEKVVEVTQSLGLEKFHVLGHSMGGYVALAMAAQRPELLKSLTLFFSSFLADDEDKKTQRLKSLRIIREAFPAYVRAGIPNLFNPNEKIYLEHKVALATEMALTTNNEGALAAVKGMVERADQSNVIADFQERILMLAGKHDDVVPTQELMDKLPDRTNIRSYLVDCGHNGHWEKPEVCAAIINTELLEHLPKKLVL